MAERFGYYKGGFHCSWILLFRQWISWFSYISLFRQTALFSLTLITVNTNYTPDKDYGRKGPKEIVCHSQTRLKTLVSDQS